MSASQRSNGRTETPGDDAGVLSNLPRTRPQRATARRAAARTQREGGDARASRNGAGARTTAKAAGAAAKAPAKAAGTEAKAPAKATRPAAKAGRSAAKAPTKAKPQANARTSQAKATPKRAPKRVAAPREEVPRQGFECIEERATGAVPPPGGPEFVGTAAEIVGELAKAGVASGERLLRDVFSRLGL